MGPPLTALLLAALIAATTGYPRVARDDSTNFIGEGTSELATAVLQSYVDEEKNLAFSPMGYSALMAILAEGARGDTRTQLVNALHLPAEEHVARAAYKMVLADLKEKHQLNVPEFHTWFYVYKNFSIEPEFKRILLESYLTEVRNVEPLYEEAMVDPPNPELDALMNLDHDDKNGEVKHDKDDKIPEQQTMMSENKDMTAEKGEMKLENADATSEKGEGPLSGKQETIPMKEIGSDKQDMSEKPEIPISDKDKNTTNEETEFEVTPEMLENKPDSIRDKFIEDLINKELEDKHKNNNKELKKEEEVIKVSEMETETASTAIKGGDLMNSEDEHTEDMSKKDNTRSRRSLKYLKRDTVDESKREDSVTEEKKDSLVKEDASFKEGHFMEEAMLTHAMNEGAMIEEAMKEKSPSSQEKEIIRANPEKKIPVTVIQATSETDEKKSTVDDMNGEMSSMEKTEKEKTAMAEKDKKSDVKKNDVEVMDSRISRGVLMGKQDVTSGISGNSIVKKASQKPGDSLMIAFNALYYKGSWATPFDIQKNRTEVFYTSDLEKLTVPTMRAEGTFNIGHIPELDSVAIELPYQGDRYSLLVVLPNKRDGLRSLVAEHLAQYPLKNIGKHMSPKHVKVCLPSFEVETTTKPLDALRKLGVSDVFSKEKANLSGISKESGLFVDELAQFVTIKVEPSHSETNYLTVAGSNSDRPETRGGEQEEEELKFVASHPFLYFVMDRKVSGLVVVAGKVTDPTYKTSAFVKKVKF